VEIARGTTVKSVWLVFTLYLVVLTAREKHHLCTRYELKWLPIVDFTYRSQRERSSRDPLDWEPGSTFLTKQYPDVIKIIIYYTKNFRFFYDFHLHIRLPVVPVCLYMMASNKSSHFLRLYHAPLSTRENPKREWNTKLQTI